MQKVEFNGLQFIMNEDQPNVGVYLYVYENGKCIRDYLQNDKSTCIEIAFEEFDVPKELWQNGTG